MPKAKATTTAAPATMGHNNPPTDFELLTAEIDGYYTEAKNWADGTALTSQEQHDEVERLYDILHAAGKRADAARIAEKKPHDDAIAEIQGRWNTLIGDTKAVRGRVVLGKAALLAAMTPWRNKVAAEREAAAKAARDAADAAAQAARDAMRASAGDLEAREAAEVVYQDAKRAERVAGRTERAATTGTGLRTVWHADVTDDAAALDWAYTRAPDRFVALVQGMADEAVRGGARDIPGVRVWSERVAA